jgi:hypothetical protein
MVYGISARIIIEQYAFLANQIMHGLIIASWLKTGQCVAFLNVILSAFRCDGNVPEG